MLRSVKNLLRRSMPGIARRYHRAGERRFEGQSPKDVFTTIYREGLWGTDQNGGFHSGGGSRDPGIVQPYVTAIREFAGSFESKLDAVDLGCGDFHVGSQLHDAFASYVACDVVEDLILHHAANNRYGNVDFRCVDIVTDPLPVGDVALIRQVLQHLSNEQIMKALPKLAEFRYLIVTEHLPGGQFTPNADKPAGPGIRLGWNSGVVIGAPPFEITSHQPTQLLDVAGEEPHGGRIVTTLWTRLH